MSDAGLTLTQQPPLSPLVSIRADGTAHRLWRRMAGTDEFRREFVSAVGGLVSDADHRSEQEDTLRKRGVDALGGVYAGMLTSLADADRPAFFDTLRMTAQFGTPGRSVAGWHVDFGELADGPLAVLRESERAPTVAVRVDDSFWDMRPDHRESVMWLFAELARAVDLRVVASSFVQTKLRQQYHETLPVSRPCNAPQSDGEVATRVEAAREAFDPDGRETKILRDLAREASETASYHALYADAHASESRVRQCVGRLADHGLVSVFDGASGRTAELLAAGREYLDALDSEIGVQQSISECVSETGQPIHDSRVSPPAHEGRPSPAVEGEAGPERHRLPYHHQVKGLSRWHATGTTAVARENGVALVDRDWPTANDRGEPGWFYDADENCVTVSAEYDNPMKGWVCVARPLASPWTFRHILFPEAFDGEETDTRLSELFSEFRHVLRGSRCVGYLKDAATGEEYVEPLQDAEEHLCELTRRWNKGEFECSAEEYRSLITREALGLASTMVHLLDLADVDVQIELRVPNYRKRDKSDRRTLARSIAKGAAIQSRYGEFAAYRQLHEQREEKRENAIRPAVDMADPLGECIPSFVVTGPGVGDPDKGDDGDGDDLAALIADEIDSLDRHEDAPEFAVHVPIDERADERRTATAQAVQQACSAKDLSPTRRAVSWFHAFVATPYDTARALSELGAETKVPGRKLAHHDVRYALSTLDTKRVLSEMKPTIGAMLTTLCTTDPDATLSNTDIENRGGPSARSIRRHADALEAFGVLVHTDAGWQLPDCLPVETTGERGFVRDTVAEAVHTLIDPGRYADPDDPVGSALFAGPGRVLPALREAWPWLDPWVRLVRGLLDEDIGPPNPPTATFGDPPPQVSVVASPGVAG